MQNNVIFKLMIAIAGAFLLVGSMGAVAARSTTTGQAPPGPVDAGEPLRTADGAGRAPDISFIDSPGATCYVAAKGTGACYIQWSYLYVEAASSQYMISMTVAIDDRMRAYHAGFFQTAIYIPGDMFDPGFRVDCGDRAPGGAGAAGFGNTYRYTLRARDTAGLTAANYGTVTCPADVARTFLPMIRKRK